MTLIGWYKDWEYGLLNSAYKVRDEPIIKVAFEYYMNKKVNHNFEKRIIKKSKKYHHGRLFIS